MLGAVVAAVPDDTATAGLEGCAERADLAVHVGEARDVAVPLGRGGQRESRQGLRAPGHGFVGRVEPDHGERRAALGRAALDELQRPGDDQGAVVADEIVGAHHRRGARPVARAVGVSGVRVDHGIEGGHLGLGGEALVEAVHPGRSVMGVVLRPPAPVRIHDVAGQGPQVPLPEEPGAPSRGAEGLAEVELLGVEMSDVGPVDAHARGVAPGEDARTGRGADRRGGVEAAQLDAVAQERVHVRRSQ